jgi:acyl-CoA synthetase (AMP-forming)/AMP-acid ligase II
MLPRRFATFAEALAAAPPDKHFVTMWQDEDDVQTVTFGEFARIACLQAEGLRGQGLRSAETVILVMPQGIPLMATFAGAILLGAVPAILAYPNFKTDPVKYSSGLAGVLATLEAPLVVVDSEPAETLLLKHLPKNTRARIVRIAPFSDDRPRFPDISREPERIAFIQHSSGTTGLQKGVALSHAAVLRQLDHLVGALRITDDDRVYSWLPLYHDMGLIACFMLPLACHLHVVMQSPTTWVAQPGTMIRLISEWRCTLAWVPNFALQFLSRRVRPEDRAPYSLTSLRALINCSEPVRAESIDEFVTAYEPLGLTRDAVKSSFAMAENVFAVTQSEVAGSPRRLSVDRQYLLRERIAVPVPPAASGSVFLVSSGRCLPGHEIRLINANGATVRDGHVGEILIHSDCLFDGYFRRPDLTAQVLHDGWYHTGDLGLYLDGELYVIGRSKDLIIVAGKNIYPQDVEHIVCQHPAIHDGRAVAFGLPNPDLGTEDIIVAAEVEDEAELANRLQIERALRDSIVAELDVAVRAIYLKPPRWIIKSTAGKTARSTTRQKLLSEHPELQRSQSLL